MIFAAYLSRLTFRLEPKLESLSLHQRLSTRQKLKAAPPTPVRRGVRNPPSK